MADAKQGPRRRTGTSRAGGRARSRAALDGGRYASYERLYGRGGFGHRPEPEWAWLEGTLLPLTGWGPGTRVIELGAGEGVHAEGLRRLGLDVTAVEVSDAGVALARTTWPDLDVVRADAARWSTDRPGHVYARGMSWFHYELVRTNRHGVNVPACTARVMTDLVAPGCLLVAQMSTDLSGRRPDEKVHHNTVDDFLHLFGPLGEDVRVVDWSGNPIQPGFPHDRGVIVICRKAA